MDSQGRNNVVSLAEHRARVAAQTAAEAEQLEAELSLTPEGQRDAINEIRSDVADIKESISQVAEALVAQADAQAEAQSAPTPAPPAPAPVVAQVAQPKKKLNILELAAITFVGAWVTLKIIEMIQRARHDAEVLRLSSIIEMERAQARADGAAEAWEMAHGKRVEEVQPIVEQAARSWLSKHRDELKGERGEQGIQGIRGERGMKGARGERGVRGAQGRSIRGAKGERGEQGRQGARGARGPSGDTVHRHSHSLDVGSMVRFGAALGKAAARGPRGEKGEKGRDGRVTVRKMPSKKVNYWG